MILKYSRSGEKKRSTKAICWPSLKHLHLHKLYRLILQTVIKYHYTSFPRYWKKDFFHYMRKDTDARLNRYCTRIGIISVFPLAPTCQNSLFHLFSSFSASSPSLLFKPSLAFVVFSSICNSICFCQIISSQLFLIYFHFQCKSALFFSDASRPISQPQSWNPSLKAYIPASRLKSQPQGSKPSLKAQNLATSKISSAPLYLT